MEQKELEQAKGLFEAAIVEQPSHAQALNALGRAAALRGDKKRAEELYVKAIGAKSDYGYSYHNLSQLLFGDRRFTDARRYAELGLENAPTYVGAGELKALLGAIDRESKPRPQP